MCSASKPSMPPTPPKPVVQKDVREVTTAARTDQKDKARKALGPKGAILTGGLGLGDVATTKKKLLSGAA